VEDRVRARVRGRRGRHAELLWLPVLRAGHRWVQVAATALIATLALLIDC
jgi:hypothetical protein